jgi:signal transduction histidine kinase
MIGEPQASRPWERLGRWLLSVPMFIKVFGIGVLVVVTFSVLTLGWLQLELAERLAPGDRLQIARSVLLGVLFCLAIAAGMAALLARLVTRPIDRLVHAAQRLGEGSFDARAEVGYDDEIGHLATAFNRMAERLEQYNREVESKEQARLSLLERIVDAQEEERRHIARELHDQLGQSLMALLLSVQSECKDRSLPEPFCANLEAQIRGLGEEIHRLAWGMRPSILDDYGLDSALDRYLSEVAQQSKLEVDFQCSSPPNLGRLPDRLEVALYRIVQEAVTNVLRHARARRLSVVVLRQRDELTLLIEDDGCGFDPGAHLGSGSGRLGLGGMQERAALFGGQCVVESESGRGTTIRVKIPLHEEQPCLSDS